MKRGSHGRKIPCRDGTTDSYSALALSHLPDAPVPTLTNTNRRLEKEDDKNAE